MKTYRISKILGWGLATGLVFALGAAILLPTPSAAQPSEMEWTTVTTPSEEDGVIVPGSDIFSYCFGPDGDTIYALGAIKGAHDTNNPGGWEEWETSPGGGNAIGLTGSFAILGGEFILDKISDELADFEGEFDGVVCGELGGDFTAILEIELSEFDGTAAIFGTIDDGELEFEGKLYTTSGTMPDSTVYPVDGTTELNPVISIENWMVANTDVNLGGVTIEFGYWDQPRVWKSTDGGETWADITSNIQDVAPGPYIQFLYGGVACSPEDEDWVAICGGIFHPDFSMASGPLLPKWDGIPAVVASQDGGDTFTYGGDMVDPDASSMMWQVYTLDVAPEMDDIINVAVGGIATIVSGGLPVTPSSTSPFGSIFRLQAGAWLSADWEDTTTYDGWDDFLTGCPSAPITMGVQDIEYSGNWLDDGAIVAMTVDQCLTPYLQSGIWDEDGGAWNGEGGFSDAVEISDDGEGLLALPGVRSMGVALPQDYDGTDSNAQMGIVYVNAYNIVTELVGGNVFHIVGDDVSIRCSPSGDPLLASVDFHGDSDTGKAMLGTYIDWKNISGEDEGYPRPWESCEGVAVYFTEEIDLCCPEWESACKDPSGPYMALVSYTPDGDKAYAVTSGTLDFDWFDMGPWYMEDYWAGWADESAFSVSLDDGYSWNQLGLIDTDIDFISDVQVCPDCETVYMSTINNMEGMSCTSDAYPLGGWIQHPTDVDTYGFCSYESTAGWVEVCDNEYEFDCDESAGDTTDIYQTAECDSIWRSEIDGHGNIGDAWQRVYHGNFSDTPSYPLDPAYQDPILLRLPCDETEDCCTLYMADHDSNNLWYTQDCGQCWTKAPATKLDIQDVAVESENIVYVLDDEGFVSVSTSYGRRPTAGTDTGIETGHSISACCEEGLVVVGGMEGGPVAYSEDGAESFSLTDDLPDDAEGPVHVACDHLCDGIFYAAVSGVGIYRGDLSDDSFTDLNAMPYNYYGLVVGKSDGTLYAATDQISVDTKTGEDLCDTILEPGDSAIDAIYSGVARNLTPCDTACCGEEDWDYLYAGLGSESCTLDTVTTIWPSEHFNTEPTALRICGCATIATNSVLWAIDFEHYDLSDGSDGTLWWYEDCAAKKGPVLSSPTNGTVINCDPCSCHPVPFTLKWVRDCQACSYDIEIMDEDGNVIADWEDEYIEGEPPELHVTGSDLALLAECGMNYTWHVRIADTETGECVKSPWSDTWTFTVAAGDATALQLISPNPLKAGENLIVLTSVPFSWTSVQNATSYSIVISPNSDLSSALASADVTGTAYTYTGTLDYGTTYYWQVISFIDGTILNESIIGAFTTILEAEEPPPSVIVEEQAPPQINIPPAQQITPTWIYAIIGIGCALAVVVIVLIVRTRQKTS